MNAPAQAARRLVLTLVLGLLVAAPAAKAATTYRVETADSTLGVLVFRSGALSAFGHNHVVVTRALSGTIVLREPLADSSITLEFPVDSLEVDAPADRAETGKDFGSEVSAKDIAATRANMTGPKLLDAARHPVIRIESGAIEGGLPNVSLTAKVEVRGAVHPVTVPVSVSTFDGGLVAVGSLRLSHGAIGLEPFRAALGTLRVANEMQVRFRIVARRE